MTTVREQPSALDSVGLEGLIQESLAVVESQKNTLASQDKPFTLKRGTATIPLSGLDVPFHSRWLLGGVPAFRELMRPKFKKEILYGNRHEYIHDRCLPKEVCERSPLAKSRGEWTWTAFNYNQAA
ncbi:3-oxoacyl-[acyl-carrier-protein] synthase [Aphanomyces cochlioides]|nr:3-oxoacyl-[acyl-carrier-protein] synthase [Aphanomyces cochlioides]